VKGYHAPMSARHFVLVLLTALLPLAAMAQDQAFTNRSTELKDRAASDARTVSTLPENTAVKVMARGGGWTRVDAAGQQGWVRVFHLRFPTTVDSSASTSAGGGLSSLTSALGFGRQKTQQATIATTGIRGLSPEDLKNASPDPEALRRMLSFRADKASADRFARDGKLAAVQIDYPQGKSR
jgi:hypothetical protein